MSCAQKKKTLKQVVPLILNTSVNYAVKHIFEELYAVDDVVAVSPLLDDADKVKKVC